MKLTEIELIDVAEILHGYDWFTEGKALIPIYQSLLKSHITSPNVLN